MSWLFLGDKESNLLRIRRAYFFTDKYVRERLIVVDSTIWVDEQKIIIEFFRDIRRILDFRQDIFKKRPFLGVRKDSSILKQINHCTNILLLEIIIPKTQNTKHKK